MIQVLQACGPAVRRGEESREGEGISHHYSQKHLDKYFYFVSAEMKIMKYEKRKIK